MRLRRCGGRAKRCEAIQIVIARKGVKSSGDIYEGVMRRDFNHSVLSCSDK